MSSRFGGTRTQTKGDERRTALLVALEELLREVDSVVAARLTAGRAAFRFHRSGLTPCS